MTRNLFALILVLGIVGSVSAADWQWTNASPDTNSFCDALNWQDEATGDPGIPGINDYVIIRTYWGGDIGPHIDCYVDVREMEGPGGNQPMSIGSGGNFNIGYFWNWDDVGTYFGPTTVNITGDPAVNIGTYWDIGERTGSVFTLNISDNPTITVGDNMKTTYDDTRTRFNMNMSGGSLDVEGRLSWGDVEGDEYDRGGGGGTLNVSGGATITCNTFSFTSGGQRDWTLNLDGGTIFVENEFSVPGNDPVLAVGDSNAFINLDAGTLECGSFDNDGYLYRMDINEGIFIIHGAEYEPNMLADVTAGYITAFNGTEDVIVEVVDGNTIVRADFVPLKATAPSPKNYSLSECPGVELSWTAGAEAAATQGHYVYFGTDINDVTDANASVGLGVYKGRQDSTVYPETGTLAVAVGETYYWRIDETDGSEIWTGDVWQFTINDGRASEPSPRDLAVTVSPFAELQWSSGCEAESHDVYLGTNFDEVENATTATTDLFKVNQPGTTYTPDSALEYFTYYYWRIDEVVGGTKYKGKTWQFRTGSYIPDENQILWYELDETVGSFVFDSSGYEHHGSTSEHLNNSHWEPNNGHVEGCLDFDGDGHIIVPGNTLDSLTDAVSVAVWLNGFDDDDDMVIFDAGDENYKMRGIVPTEGPELDIYWRAGNDTNDVLVWEEATPEMWLDEWHHYAFVKDETAGTMKIYFDGIAVESKTDTISSLTNVKDTTFKVGSKTTSNSDFDGKMDNFRVYDKALTDIEVAALFIGGDIQQPWGPTPFNGETDVVRETNLTWRSGQGIVSHDVYFGTDLAAVTDANTAVTLGVYKGNQPLEANSYDPDLELGTTYYWRIDEVNDADANSPWGRIWTFTVANYIIIEDFETYDNVSNYIYYTWVEDDASVYQDLGVDPFNPVHSGEQSLWFEYNNAYGSFSDKYYSEVSSDLGGMDFTQAGVKTLTVFFYGQSFNDAGSTEDPYMGISDGTTYAQSHYSETGNPISDIQEEEWHEWNVALSDFTGVSLGSIDTIYIGVGIRGNTVPGGGGEIFFDDLRLYPPKCVPELGPVWDFSDNCIVDLADVGVIADEWLRTDAILDVEAPTSGPVAHWELDDWFWMIEDSAGSNDGQAEGEYSWATGKSGDCIEFSGEGGRVRVPHAEELMPTDAVSVTVWLNAAEEPDDYSARVVVKGIDEDNWEAYYVQFNDDSEAQWTIRDPNHQNNGTTSGSLGLNEWIHVAGTYDGETVKLYVNGQLEDQDSTSGVDILYDINDLSIGNRSDNNATPFIGKIDDVRVYDYALNAAEVAYIATLSTGDPGTAYVPLVSQVNIYDGEAQGEKAINFRDLAELMTAWMEEQLWPE